MNAPKREPMKGEKKRKGKRVMTDGQLAELENAKDDWQGWREQVYTAKGCVHESEGDVREAQANLRKDKKALAEAKRHAAAAKKKLDKLAGKYKNHARPKAVSFS